MPRTIIIEAAYPGHADQIFAEALHLGEMTRAMQGLATYDGLPDRRVVQGDRFTVDVTLWGFLRTKSHVMAVERLDAAARVLQSREHNPNVKRWDHCISIQPHDGGALWTDTIVLDAGWQTYGTALFCRHVYGYRHKVRQALSVRKRIIRS